MDLGYLIYIVLDRNISTHIQLGDSPYQGSIPSVQDYFCSVFILSYLLFHLHYVHWMLHLILLELGHWMLALESGVLLQTFYFILYRMSLSLNQWTLLYRKPYHAHEPVHRVPFPSVKVDGAVSPTKLKASRFSKGLCKIFILYDHIMLAFLTV